MSDQKTFSANAKVSSDFEKVYEPLVKKFIEEIKDVNKQNLPEPFIPVCGTNYESSSYKIAFVGWETRNNLSLTEFYESAKKNPGEALNRFYEIIDLEEDFNLTNYANNFGTGFWNFIFKFLAKLINEEWKEIKQKKHPEILKSFVWGNLDSIERYEVSAKGACGNSQEWEKVKKASNIFDNAEVFIEALKPKLIIVLQWQEDDLWIKGIKNIEHEIIVGDYLEYYHLKDSDTHIYWTRHPRGFTVDKIDEYISRIFISINEKNIFPKYPGKKLFDSIGKLNLQLKELGDEFGLQFDKLPYWGSNSGFYFTGDKWKDYMIGFEFDEIWGKSLFGGIRKVDNNNPLISDELIAQKLRMNEKPTPYWPYWFWFEEMYKNWNINTFDEIQNGNFLSEIRKQVNRIQSALDKLES